MRTFFKDNGLTIALITMFLLSALGHLLAGHAFENKQLASHGEPSIALLTYLADPQYLSSLLENWESEFLQMSAYVVLTAMLFQKGSSESADPEAPPRDERMAGGDLTSKSPAALRFGAGLRWLYAHSLGIVLFLLFLASFIGHWLFSATQAAEDARAHGEAPPSTLDYLVNSQFWFESFQNWQSEFLSTAVLVVLSIYLRQRGSPESKPVGAPHDETGN